MKKIGKQVAFLQTSPDNPRNGEGSFVKLKNGDVMYVYTSFCGGRADHASANLSACISRDGGESWGEPFSVLERDDGAENIMSPSLFRMSDGGIGMVYLRKEQNENGEIICMPFFALLSEEGAVIGEPVVCTQKKGYYCSINDGAIVMKNGRILVPLAFCGDFFIYKKGFYGAHSTSVRFVYSDDCGLSWQDLDGEILSPFEDGSGLEEPGVYEYENGELWVWCRTYYGFQYQSFSCDGGKSWSEATPNLFFTSPNSPMRVKRVGDCTVAVFNPIPHNSFVHTRENWGAPKRTPLACAVCRQDGRAFRLAPKAPISRELREKEKMLYLIEDDFKESYCYPAIIDVEDGFLVAYYHSAGSSDCLNCAKITKILYSELD